MRKKFPKVERGYPEKRGNFRRTNRACGKRAGKILPRVSGTRPRRFRRFAFSFSRRLLDVYHLLFHELMQLLSRAWRNLNLRKVKHILFFSFPFFYILIRNFFFFFRPSRRSYLEARCPKIPTPIFHIIIAQGRMCLFPSSSFWIVVSGFLITT